MKNARSRKKSGRLAPKKARRLHRFKTMSKKTRSASKTRTIRRSKAKVKRLARKAAKTRVRARATRKVSVVATPIRKSKIVRIMGHGQYAVNSSTLKKLNQIDNSIVQLVSNERSDDNEFKKHLAQLTEIVVKDGRPLDPKEIIRSDIILPSADLSADEAKKLFRGGGVIPEI